MTDHREIPNQRELDAVRELMGASIQDLEYAQKETAEFLSYLSVEELRAAAERVVDLYFKSENATYGCSYGFNRRCTDPFAKALLETLLYQEDVEMAEKIAYRVVRGVAVAVGFKKTYLNTVGIAAHCNFPAYMGQSD